MATAVEYGLIVAAGALMAVVVGPVVLEATGLKKHVKIEVVKAEICVVTGTEPEQTLYAFSDMQGRPEVMPYTLGAQIEHCAGEPLGLSKLE